MSVDSRYSFVVLVVLGVFAVTHAQSDFRADSCDDPVSSCSAEEQQFPEETRIEFNHAKTIQNVSYANSHVNFDILVRELDDSTTPYKFKLVKCGCPPGEPDGREIFYTNPRKVYVDEGPIIALLVELFDDADKIKYVDLGKYIYNQEVRDGIGESITEIRDPETFERDYSILTDDPDVGLSMLGSFHAKEYDSTQVGVPFMAFAEQSEATALGRAEWMKLVGLVFDEPQKATEKFDEIVEAYNDAKEVAAEARRRPSVFFNFPSYNSSAAAGKKFMWGQPTNDQYIVNLVLDANADYRYASEDSVGGIDANSTEIESDFRSAAYLLNSGPFVFDSEADLEGVIDKFFDEDAEGDDSFKDGMLGLRAVRCGNVWHTGNRQRGEAVDFLESGIFNPHIILQDYIRLLHPSIETDDSERYFYMKSFGDAPEGSECAFEELDDDPPDGETFAERNFAVPGMNRFQVEDELETEVLPELKEALPDQSVEVLFKGDSSDEKNTTVTVRTAVDDGDVSDFEESEEVLAAMRRSLGDDVQNASPSESTSSSSTPTPDADADDDGGLGGGAIFGIVAVVLAAIAVGIYLLYRRKSRKGPPIANVGSNRGQEAELGETEDIWSGDAGSRTGNSGHESTPLSV